MVERQRQRRTLGSGPPHDLLYGEIAYSDGDGLIHVGRPDGGVRSFGGEPEPQGWAEIQDKPLVFPPATHGHQWAEIPFTLVPGITTFMPGTHPTRIRVNQAIREIWIDFSLSASSVVPQISPLLRWENYAPDFVAFGAIGVTSFVGAVGVGCGYAPLGLSTLYIQWPDSGSAKSFTYLIGSLRAIYAP